VKSTTHHRLVPRWRGSGKLTGDIVKWQTLVGSVIKARSFGVAFVVLLVMYLLGNKHKSVLHSCDRAAS